ncbi:MAG: YbhB/YbcL family Raf kinase inhibitor-like protein [Polyangiaceae bacterium]|nr:YbhB/YbcL family Raf kinase inhibitor-like protein [Polyangiaceae bacterium]
MRQVETFQSRARTPGPARLSITSVAFADGSTIPRRHTADGDDLSPRLTLGAPPAGTASFALVCEDPDAPSGLFTHWIAWNIDPATRDLPEGIPTTAPHGIRQGENGFGDTGWRGPSPPRGRPHRYVFRVIALDAPLDLESGANRSAFDRAIEGHALAEGKLIGMYGR